MVWIIFAWNDLYLTEYCKIAQMGMLLNKEPSLEAHIVFSLKMGIYQGWSYTHDLKSFWWPRLSL